MSKKRFEFKRSTDKKLPSRSDATPLEQMALDALEASKAATKVHCGGFWKTTKESLLEASRHKDVSDAKREATRLLLESGTLEQIFETGFTSGYKVCAVDIKLHGEPGKDESEGLLDQLGRLLTDSAPASSLPKEFIERVEKVKDELADRTQTDIAKLPLAKIVPFVDHLIKRYAGTDYSWHQTVFCISQVAVAMDSVDPDKALVVRDRLRAFKLAHPLKDGAS